MLCEKIIMIILSIAIIIAIIIVTITIITIIITIIIASMTTHMPTGQVGSSSQDNPSFATSKVHVHFHAGERQRERSWR